MSRFESRPPDRGGLTTPDPERLNVIEIVSVYAARRFKDGGAKLIAALVSDPQGTHDLSSEGLEQTRSFDPTDQGLCTRALTLEPDNEPNLVFATPAPNRVSKAFVAGYLSNMFSHHEFSTPSGVNLGKFAAVVDSFDRDLVHGWPRGGSVEEKALMVANSFTSHMMKVEDLPKLVGLLREIFECKDIEADYSEVLELERERQRLASSFSKEVFKEGALSVVVVDETTASGFHPGVYCQESGAQIAVVVRRDSVRSGAYVSCFAGIPEARSIDPTLGLRVATKILNGLDIPLGSTILNEWGGDETRFSWNRSVRGSSEESMLIARQVANVLAKKLSELRSA